MSFIRSQEAGWRLVTARRKGEYTNKEDNISRNDGNPKNEINAEARAKHVIRSRNQKAAVNRKRGVGILGLKHCREKELVLPGHRQGYKRKPEGGCMGM